MSARRPALVALALWAVAGAVAGAACSAIGDSAALTDAQQAIADMKIGPSDVSGAELKIIGGVDHGDRRYRVGEPVTLSVEVNKAAFVAVLRVMPNGATTLVFPNRQHATAQVPANSPLRIPEPGAPFTITADKPGVVLFEFVAASRGGSWLFNRTPGTARKGRPSGGEGSADFAELGTTTRALAKDIVISLGVGHGADIAAAHLALRAEAP